MLNMKVFVIVGALLVSSPTFAQQVERETTPPETTQSAGDGGNNIDQLGQDDATTTSQSGQADHGVVDPQTGHPTFPVSDGGDQLPRIEPPTTSVATVGGPPGSRGHTGPPGPAGRSGRVTYVPKGMVTHAELQKLLGGMEGRLARQISALAAQNRAGFARVDGRLTAIDARTGEVLARIDHLPTREEIGALLRTPQPAPTDPAKKPSEGGATQKEPTTVSPIAWAVLALGGLAVVGAAIAAPRK